MHTSRDAERIERDALLAEYATYGVPRERWRIGGEFERHLLRRDGSPLPYTGERGVRWLLETLHDAGGWTMEREGEAPIALWRGGASVTLEPGAQFEFSGHPFHRVGELMAEAQGFTEQVRQALQGQDVTQVALGFTPFARVPDIEWVPKGRYKVMRTVLAARGDLAHHMMKGTCAVQASYDFTDEADCANKVRIGVQLGALTTALFANSPYTEGRANGWASFRGHIWTRTDPDRTGFPPAALDFSYARWIDYLLDVPMMFTKLNGQWADARGRTFREWLDHGIDGQFPTRADWNLHLTSVFPEVRVKKQIEVRGADCVSAPLSAAFCALFEGLFYCEKTLGQTLDVADRFARAAPVQERFEEACRDGLRGTVGGRRLADWAAEVVQLAHEGLGRCAPEDQAYLAPLLRLAERGQSPAHVLLEQLGPEPDPVALREVARIDAPWPG